MLKNILKFIIFVAFIYFLLLSLQPTRFYMWYPTIQRYPNNNVEIGIIIRDYINKRTPEDIKFFKLTDSSPLEAFRDKISEKQFRRLTTEKDDKYKRFANKITYYQKLFNRARPEQVAPKLIDSLNSNSDDTPSYPSGHAFHVFYAAKLLSQWEPHRKKEWDEIAERSANIRVIAGLHYPSDIEFAKKLVDNTKL
jgi:hypothetical protein